MRTRPRIFAAVLAAAVLATCSAARAQGAAPAPPAERTAPEYTLDVDSDAPEVLAYEAVAPRLASDLGGTVTRAGGGRPASTAITIRYRDATRSLSVRAVHVDGRLLEREVRAEGDAAAVQREAVLLAGNLARDEARELIDELEARKAPSPPVPPTEVPVPELPEAPPTPRLPLATSPPEERTFATFAVLYPLATNAGHPDIRTSFATSLFYGRVGRSDALDLGLGVTYASRGVDGVQMAMAATFTGGRVKGVQIAVGGNVARGDVTGAQVASGANIALSRLTGVQAAVVNTAGEVEGAQVGLVNVARHVKGAQIGVVNVAEEVEGTAIGLVSISRNAIHPLVWTSNLAYTNIGIKFATKYAYTLVAIGFGTLESKLKFADPSFTLAVGGHIPIVAGFDLDLETAYSELQLESPAEANRALHVRALPGWSFAKHLRIFAGGGVRIPAGFDRGSSAARPEGLAGVQF